MASRCRDWAGRCYARVPDRVDEALLRLWHGWREAAGRQVGIEMMSNGSCRVLAAGRATSMDYFLDRLPGGMPRVESSRTVSRGALAAALHDQINDADLLLARLPRRWLQRHPGAFDGRWWRVPEVVGEKIVLPESDTANLIPWKNASNQNNLARIRKHNLSWSISHDERDFDYFYHRMYLPFLAQRYGEQSQPRSEHRIRRRFRQGGILWVTQGERKLAAEVFSIRGRQLSSLLMAPEPRYPDAVKMGSLSATYLFMLQWAWQQGCREVLEGVSRPSLSDGVVIHKKHWGAQLVDSPDARHDLLFAWPRFTPPIARFLHESPLVVRDGDQLSGLTTMPLDASPDPGLTEQHLKSIASAGLSRLHVIADPPWRCDSPRAKELPICWISSQAAVLPISG
ncbi:MAG: hypothetical protein IT445_17755 [Phycisphaeraceae bacterium]|nr:hypothetical protein [Phycisphaeraceae bacterium]